jgi:uncharacterized protein YciI
MRIILTVIALFAFYTSFGQEFETKTDPNDGCPIFEMPEGDTVWVMKQYMMVIYFRGENRTQPKAEADSIQAGHLAHINHMGKEGFLSVAGPFGDDTDMRGILIFHVATEEKVRELMKGDPAVTSGRLTYEVHPWWGAKGSVLK